MPDLEVRILELQRLASRFDESAAASDSRAAEFRARAGQESRESEEKPVAEELMGIAAYWDERAAWSRRMADRFRGHVERNRARLSPGP